MTEATKEPEDLVTTNGQAGDDLGEVIDERQEPEKVTLRRDGRLRTLFVHEMDGDQLAKWMKVLGSRFVTGKDGESIKQDYTGFHADLIHLCLRTPDGSVVPKEMIERFGAKAQNHLFSICQRMNGLSDTFRKQQGKG